jgi:DNA-binding response OmpR family regulator
MLMKTILIADDSPANRAGLSRCATSFDPEHTLAGCDAYIAKPLRLQDLYAAIDILAANRIAKGKHVASSAEEMDATGPRKLASAQSVIAKRANNDTTHLRSQLVRVFCGSRPR